MTPHDPSRLLRASLRANAVFSAISGIAMIAAANPLTSFLGTERPELLVGVGTSLLVFAAGLLRNSRRSVVNLAEARVAVGLDLGWVLGSAAVVVSGTLTTGGNWLVAGVADVVLVLAILQFAGLRRARATRPVAA